MAKTFSAGGVAHGAKYWRLTIDVKESGGERRRLTKTTKIACTKNSTRGRSAALTALRQWRDELIRQAEAEDSVGSGTPTADYAEDFITRHSEVAPATREEYMRAVRDLRLARIGEVPISMLKPSDVQDWMIWLRDERGLGSASRNKKHGVLAMVCKYAAAIGDAPIIATGLLKAPKDLPKPVNSLTESSALEVAAQLRARLPEPLALAGIIALMTGMRRGEICALMWRDFDAKAGTLGISRTLHSKGQGIYALGDTKTSQGNRTIILPESVAALLRARKKNSISQWIFPQPTSPELPMNPGTAYRRLKTLLEKAGLPSIRFHDLRHTFATHALTSGVDAKTLAGILGHTNASFTLDTYTHVTPDMREAAGGIVGGFMEDLFGKELKPWQRSEKQATD